MYLTRTPRDSDVAPDLGNVGLKQCFSSCQLLPTAKKINLVSSDQDLKKKVGGMNWEIMMHNTHSKGKDCFMIYLLSICIYIYSNVCFMNDKLFTVDHDPKCWGVLMDTMFHLETLVSREITCQVPAQTINGQQESGEGSISPLHVSAILCLG